jgi:hypothetical protein
MYIPRLNGARGKRVEIPKSKRGQELIIDIISVLITLFANFFGFFRAV